MVFTPPLRFLRSRGTETLREGEELQTNISPGNMYPHLRGVEGGLKLSSF